MSNKLTDLEAARLEGKDRRKYFQGISTLVRMK